MAALKTIAIWLETELCRPCLFIGREVQRGQHRVERDDPNFEHGTLLCIIHLDRPSILNFVFTRTRVTSIYELLCLNADTLPQATAICGIDSPAISYGALFHCVTHMIRLLRQMNIQPLDRVAIVLPDGGELFERYLRSGGGSPEPGVSHIRIRILPH